MVWLQRHCRVIGLALLLLGSLLHACAGYSHDDLSGHAQGSDDAYISYRYARNLSHGHGLVFNPGERVEGYSNLLYVLLISPAFWLTEGGPVYGYSVALNLLFAAGAFLVFERLTRRRLGEVRGPLAALLLALCPAAWLWVASGLETPLVLLLTVALWLLIDASVEGRQLRPPFLLPLVIMLSVLARADGFVVPALAVGYLLLRGQRRTALQAGLALLLTLGTQVLWRLGYYDYPLPNTFYAKVSGPMLARAREGLTQFWLIALGGGLLPHLAALLAALAIVLKRVAGEPAARSRVPFEPILAAGWILYWIYVGGDVFAERFLLILYPLGAFVLLDSRLAARSGRRGWALAGLLGLFQLWPLVLDPRFHYTLSRYDRWVTLGRFLAQERYRGWTLAVCAAGKVPYFSGLTTIDMLGLSDEHIAHRPVDFFVAGHSKYDADYVLGRRPDLIATWIDPRLDLRFDLSREKYARAGYRLTHLVYTRTEPPGPALIEVSRLDEDSVSLLIRRGYRYALLERIPAAPG